LAGRENLVELVAAPGDKSERYRGKEIGEASQERSEHKRRLGGFTKEIPHSRNIFANTIVRMNK